MAYITAKEVTSETALRAKKLALEMKKLIEENFLLAPNEDMHQRLRLIRSQLFELGFHCTYSLELDLQNRRLAAHVTIYVLKEPKHIS